MIDGTRYSLLILFIIPIRGLRLIVYDVFDDTQKICFVNGMVSMALSLPHEWAWLSIGSIDIPLPSIKLTMAIG